MQCWKDKAKWIMLWINAILIIMDLAIMYFFSEYKIFREKNPLLLLLLLRWHFLHIYFKYNTSYLKPSKFQTFIFGILRIWNFEYPLLMISHFYIYLLNMLLNMLTSLWNIINDQTITDTYYFKLFTKYQLMKHHVSDFKFFILLTCSCKVSAMVSI